MKAQGLRLNLKDRSMWLAVIGSRKPSEPERERAYKYAYEQAKKGYIIVSGLAHGIDAKAHEGALDAGGKTIAFVNTPDFQSVYPKENQSLAERIKNQGCIIHPFDGKAIEGKEEGMYLTHFQRRLLERDVLLAKATPTIVAVCDEEIISGGTRYAIAYGKKFAQEVFRLDSSGQFFENPKHKSAKINWNPEIHNLFEGMVR